MNLIKLFVVFVQIFKLVSLQLFEINEKISFSEPANSIIKSVFMLRGYVNVRMIVANSSNLKTMFIANEILMRSSDVKFEMRVMDNGTIEYKEKRKTPLILIFESIEEFENVKPLIAIDNPEYYLAIVSERLFERFDDVIKTFWKSSASNVNFLVNSQGNFSVFTFFPFKKGSCGDKLKLTLINSFDFVNKIWMSNELFPSKIKNLHGCMLKVGVTLNTPYAMLENKFFYGIDIDIIREIARHFKFSINFNGPFETIGVIYENGSSTGLLSSLWLNINDMGIGLLSLQFERIKYLPASSFYISAATTLTMPPSSPVTALEKLLMPFDMIIWGLFILMYIGGILVIYLSRLKSKSVYEFIVGKKVYHPILNILIALVGGSQKVLPRGTFSRFLLAKCLLFCLVMRGLYQGKLFNIMQKEIQEKEPRTIDELIQKNFVFYAYDTLARRIQDVKISKRVKSISLGQLEEYRHKTLNPAFKGIIMSYEGQVAYYNYLSHKKYIYRICKERLLNNQIVFYFQRNHFLADKISEKIEWLRDFGITSYIIGRYVDLKFLIPPPLLTKTDTLHYRDLAGIFTIWLGGLTFAFITWIFEIIYFIIISKKKK